MELESWATGESPQTENNINFRKKKFVKRITV